MTGNDPERSLWICSSPCTVRAAVLVALLEFCDSMFTLQVQRQPCIEEQFPTRYLCLLTRVTLLCRVGHRGSRVHAHASLSTSISEYAS